MSLTRTQSDLQRQKQVQQAEELLFGGAQQLGVAKGIFLGRFVADWVMPYPQIPTEQAERLEHSLGELRAFLDQHLDPEQIDREANIPAEVIAGLGRLGVLGMTAPSAVGGKGFSQMAYCKVMEELGRRCGSTSVFVNVHHSVGMRALLLFGTPEQQQRWLPPLVTGKHLAAFALTESEAGSDAGNVQTRAEPSADGTHYILNGEKRYITNAAIAQVLTVMARTPVPGKDTSAVTAFLVSPEMPGFVLLEPRMEKLGLRGTATGRIGFRDMAVPRENILGPLGKGLKVALTVLDFGRTTFGACSTGAAKTCLELAVNYANQRKQFGRTLGEFELIKKKLARMAARIYAMEAMTTVTASLIDRGLEDYMLETAMLKVFTTEVLWEIINDAFQIHGGAAYFTDQPLERMLRDARINQIAEGANEVLKSFIGLVGIRGPGLQLQELQQSLRHPWLDWRRMWALGSDRVDTAVRPPQVPVTRKELAPYAGRLGRLIRKLTVEIDRVLIRYREEILERQLIQERLADAATELFAAACVLSRWDAGQGTGDHRTRQNGAGDRTPELFLMGAFRRVQQALSELHDNDDGTTVTTADGLLERNFTAAEDLG